MITTKRVDELKVGDIVIFPYCKSLSTVSYIERTKGDEYNITFEGIGRKGIYKGDTKVNYVDGKKERKIMVPYSEFSGSRLISYEFGLVVDFSINLPYSVPYYVLLTFKKGDKIMKDIWSAKSQSFDYLSYLNKIVDKKEGDLEECTYYFTDGTLIDIC